MLFAYQNSPYSFHCYFNPRLLGILWTSKFSLAVRYRFLLRSWAGALFLWLNSSLLISTAIIGILIPELDWNIDFFQLITRRRLFQITNYMFNPAHSLFLRGFSLFHIVLPIIWI